MKEIKLYARQVNPGHQDCDYLWREIKDINSEKVCITGNRDYMGVTTEEYDTFTNHIYETMHYLTMDGEITGNTGYETFEEFVNDYFYTSSKDKYNQKELAKWKELIVDFLNENVEIDEEFICRGLSIMTGKEYSYWTIRGCCQREWQILYAPIGIDADYYEKVYFNMGTEWQLSYDEDFEDCWWYYSLADDEDKIREDLVSNEGCEVDEVKIYKWVGQHYVDDYEEVV